MAHAKCRGFLLEEAQKPWSREYLEELIRKNPKLRVSCEARDRAISDWQNFQVVVPDMVFERSKVIELEGLSIELEHVGGLHAQDSIIVKVPQSRVMFIGDCYYPPPLHLRTLESTISNEILSNLVDDGIDLYIEGHDDPTTRNELVEYLSSLET
jgi:glyoxylase-like metal-dependent hydrolase (beta-lactamase superfamily II)